MLDKKNMMLVIGHITDTSVNIFVGYAYHKNIAGKIIANCFNIKDDVTITQELKPYKNYTTVFSVTGLKPGITYDMYVCISSKGDFVDKTITITTNIPSSRIVIGLCSCHYPNPIYVSDKIFKTFDKILSSYQRQLCYQLSYTPTIFHVGDQVYADQLNRFVPIKRIEQYSEFIELYENKYTGKHFSNFSSKYSSLMTLDDHEIEDNWNMDRLLDRRDLFLTAISNYKIYQASHGPFFNDNSKLYYETTIGNFPFFVLDTRTERIADKLVSDTQMEDLVKWLSMCDPNLPKFIVSSVIFCPFSKGKTVHKNGIQDKSDNWNGYSTKNKLLEFIASNNIEKVVFLSGDIHNSLAGTIYLEKKDKIIKIYQVISSPLFWPFPFANGNIEDYILNTNEIIKNKKFNLGCIGKVDEVKTLRIKDANNKTWRYRYEMYKNTHTQLNNFSILDIKEDNIDIKWYGTNGEEITSHMIEF